MKPYVVVDIETTGTQPLKSDIIEIGAVYVEDGKVTKSFNELIKPTEEISPYITSITGITNEMVADKRTIEEVMPEFVDFCKGAVLVGHNVILFDYRMLKVKATRLGLEFEKEGIDTLIISRKMLDHLPSRKLGDLCEHYGISLVNAHRAYDDAYATYEVFVKLQEGFEDTNPELFVPQKMEWDMPKQSPITLRQKAFLKKLSAVHEVELPDNIEGLTKSEASRIIDQIIREHGRV